ncbi:TRAP transporter substrate-binding protein [Rhodovulum sp. DZ06]|uniref:TRAP transporter substrate-binding protein n=1 Tax=Rhodovulum sp. DZ06 TaxID=3425126 RepID=UPI003D3373F6
MRLLNTLAAGALALAAAIPAQAADYTMTIASWAPPTHGFNAKMWPRFIEMMEKATDGKVTGEVKLGLAPPPAMMDLVLDGAADMTIIFHGYNAGRFTTTKLIELPGFEGSAEDASVAYWRVFEKHLAAANEHKGVKVFAVHTHGPAVVQTGAELSNGLADMNGLKLRVPGGVASMMGEQLGAIGIQVPAPKVYETLASNAADGVVMPIESHASFKLFEVAPNVISMPGGLYRGSFAMLMSMDTWDSLPADVQEALESKVFGEPASRVFGQVWDEADAAGRAAVAEGKFHEATEADLKLLSKISQTVTTAVLEEISATGVDAAAAYDMIKSELASMK